MFLGRIQCYFILIVCSIIKDIETRTYKYTQNGIYELLPEKYTPATKFQNIRNGIWRGLNTNIYFNEDDVETIYDPTEHRRSSVMVNDFYLLPSKSTDSKVNAIVPNYDEIHDKNFLRALGKSSIAQAKEYYKLYKDWKSIRSKYPNVFKYMSKTKENRYINTPFEIYQGAFTENNLPNEEINYPQLSDQEYFNLFNYYSDYNSNKINKNIDDVRKKVQSTYYVGKNEIINRDTEMKNKTVITNTFRNISRDNLYLETTPGSYNRIVYTKVGNGANETAVKQLTERNVKKLENHVHTNFIVNVVSDQKLKKDEEKNTSLHQYDARDTNKLYKVHEVIPNTTGTLNFNNTAKNMTLSLFRELQPEKYHNTNDIQILGLDKGIKDKIVKETIGTTDGNQITKQKKNYDAMLVSHNVDKNPFQYKTQGASFKYVTQTVPEYSNNVSQALGNYLSTTKVSAIANENFIPYYYGKWNTNGNTSATGNRVLDERARNVIDSAELKVQVTSKQNTKLSHQEKLNVENSQIGNYDPHYKTKDNQYRIADNIAINPMRQIVKENDNYGNYSSTKYFDKQITNTGVRDNSINILNVPSYKYVNPKYRYNTIPQKMLSYPNKRSKYMAQVYRIPINHNKNLLTKANTGSNLDMKIFNNKNNIGKMSETKHYKKITDVTSITKPGNKYFYQPTGGIKDENISFDHQFYNRNKFGAFDPQSDATEVNIKSSKLPPQKFYNFNKQGTTVVLNPYPSTNTMHINNKLVNSGRVKTNKFTVPKSSDMTNIQSTFKNNDVYHKGNKYLDENAKNVDIKTIGMTSNQNINNSFKGSKINENLINNRINNIAEKYDYHTQERVNTKNRYKGLADTKHFKMYPHKISSKNIRGISQSVSNNLPKFRSVTKNGQKPILRKIINKNGKITYLDGRDIETFNNIAEIVEANNGKTSMNKYKVRNNRVYKPLLYRDDEEVEGLNSNKNENTDDTLSSFDVPTQIEENIYNSNFDQDYYHDLGNENFKNSYNDEPKLFNGEPAKTTFNENINFEDKIENNYGQSSSSNLKRGREFTGSYDNSGYLLDIENESQEFAHNTFTTPHKNKLNMAYLGDPNDVKYLNNLKKIKKSSTRYNLGQSIGSHYPSNKYIDISYGNSNEDTYNIVTLTGLSKSKEKSQLKKQTTTDQSSSQGSHEYTFENYYYDENYNESKNVGNSVSHSQAQGKNFNDFRQVNSNNFELDSSSGDVYDDRYSIKNLKGKRKIVNRAKDTSKDFIKFSEEELSPPHRGNLGGIRTSNFYKMFTNSLKKINRNNNYGNHSGIMNHEKKSGVKFHLSQNIINDEYLKKIFNELHSFDRYFKNLHEYNGSSFNNLKYDRDIAVEDNDFNGLRVSTAKNMNIMYQDESNFDKLLGTVNKNVSHYGKLSSDISFINDVPTLEKSKNMIPPGITKHITIKDMENNDSSKQNKKGITTVVENIASNNYDTINVSKIDFNKTHSANILDSVNHGDEVISTNSIGPVQQQHTFTKDPLSGLKLSLNVTYHGHKNKKNSSAASRKDGINSFNISTEPNFYLLNRTHNISENHINAHFLDNLDLDQDSENFFSFYNATNLLDSSTMASLGKSTINNLDIYSTNKNIYQTYQSIPVFKNTSTMENPKIVKEIELETNNTLTTTTEKNLPYQNVKYLSTTNTLVETHKTNKVNDTKAFRIASDSKETVNYVNYGTLDYRNNKTTQDTNKDTEANPYTINNYNNESNIVTEFGDRDINTQNEIDARNQADKINETKVTTDKNFDYNNFIKYRNNSEYKLGTRNKADFLNKTKVTTDKDLDSRNSLHNRDNYQYNEASRRNNAVINFNDVVNEVLGLFKKSFDEIIQNRNKL